MKISATELMKKLKYIEEEINDIHHNDEEKAYVAVNERCSDNGTELVPLYINDYDFVANRNRIKELHQEEREIKRLLNKFNINTNVMGYDFSIAEGLVRIAELKGEIKILAFLAKTGEFTTDSYRSASLKKASFDVKLAKDTLREAQRELSALQVAIDKTNLNSQIEY